MMTDADLLDAANRAWHAGEIDRWETCIWLLRTRHRLIDEEQLQRECQLDKNDERNGDWTR